MKKAIANVGSERVRCFSQIRGFEQGIDPQLRQSGNAELPGPWVGAVDVVEPAAQQGQQNRYSFLLSAKGLPKGVEAADSDEVTQRLDGVFQLVWPRPTWDESGDRATWPVVMSAILADSFAPWPDRARAFRNAVVRRGRTPAEKHQRMLSQPNDQAIEILHGPKLQRCLEGHEKEIEGLRKAMIKAYNEVRLEAGFSESEFTPEF